MYGSHAAVALFRGYLSMREGGRDVKLVFLSGRVRSSRQGVARLQMKKQIYELITRWRRNDAAPRA